MDKPDPQFWSKLLHDLIDLVSPSAADIFSSPAKLSSLLAITADLEPLGKIAEREAIALAFKRTEIPGWTLVRREGSRYVEAAVVSELLESLSVREFVRVLPTILEWSGNISQRRYQSLCELVSRQPESKAIHQNVATVFLRRGPQSIETKTK
jgi:hypothetical protein